MARVTIIKKNQNRETMTLQELSQVTDAIRGRMYEQVCQNLREEYPLAEVHQRYGYTSSLSLVWEKYLPRVCFSAEMHKRGGQSLMRRYNGMVLLEVNNLDSEDEARAVRRYASQIPQTLLAFVGASGLSVKIVCRGELFDGGLPTADDDIRRFHVNLYEKARLAYNMQLGLTVEKAEPELAYSCHLSSDPEAYFCETSQPFYTDCSERVTALRSVTHAAAGETPDIMLLPDGSYYQAMHRIYEFCLTRALDDTASIADEDGRMQVLLTRLSGYCQESGLPMSFARRQAEFNPRLGRDKELTAKVFENAYREEHERQYRRRKGIKKPHKYIPAETLLMMKIDIFLHSNYDLRKNVMRGVAEYREKGGIGFQYQDLTDEARNSMTMRALMQGVKCWDKDITRYVNSDDIPLYEPMTDFLDHLPRWDGQDRVTPLARRITTSHDDWPHLFHIWMRSMVAMWRGKGQLTGNALVPVLIGRQGCGKTSFCRMLLPPEQRLYYNDRINFRNESDLNLGLTSFALINLDEFDKITQRQQVVLKYLVSTSDLKFRPPYGKAYSARRRYASFIATTNEPTPLTDPTGSRRFICVQVEGDIDLRTPIDYGQLYAQLEHEVSTLRLPYHLTREEEQALMQHNQVFQRISQLGEQVLALYTRPLGTPQTNPGGGQWLSLKQISARLKEVYGASYTEDKNIYARIGSILSQPECKFENERKSYGMLYWVRER